MIFRSVGFDSVVLPADWIQDFNSHGDRKINM